MSNGSEGDHVSLISLMGKDTAIVDAVIAKVQNGEVTLERAVGVMRELAHGRYVTDATRMPGAATGDLRRAYMATAVAIACNKFDMEAFKGAFNITE